MERPNLDKNISVEDFNEFYWLKSELINFCRDIGVNTSGGKIEITRKIQKYLLTGEIDKKSKKTKRHFSNFNWNTEVLNDETVITDNYKNTENVRQYFTSKIGEHFSFNVQFMNWMKDNIGKTLNDATIEWKRISELKKDKKYKTVIGKQFEYNQYIRDFLADNPSLTINNARFFWKLKRESRGDMVYKKSDLNLIKKQERRHNG